MPPFTRTVVTTVITRAVSEVQLTPLVGQRLLRVEERISGVVEYLPLAIDGHDRLVLWSDRDTAFVNLPHALVEAGLVEIVDHQLETAGTPHVTYTLRLLNPGMRDGWGALGAVSRPH